MEIVTTEEVVMMTMRKEEGTMDIRDPIVMATTMNRPITDEKRGGAPTRTNTGGEASRKDPPTRLGLRRIMKILVMITTNMMKAAGIIMMMISTATTTDTIQVTAEGSITEKLIEEIMEIVSEETVSFIGCLNEFMIERDN